MLNTMLRDSLNDVFKDMKYYHGLSDALSRNTGELYAQLQRL